MLTKKKKRFSRCITFCTETYIYKITNVGMLVAKHLDKYAKFYINNIYSVSLYFPNINNEQI